MTAIEQADALTQQAIELLLAEREQIDQRLAQLGDKKTTPGKKRGRPSKDAISDSGRPDSSPPALT
jgi:hypothetical protein